VDQNQLNHRKNADRPNGDDLIAQSSLLQLPLSQKVAQFVTNQRMTFPRLNLSVASSSEKAKKAQNASPSLFTSKPDLVGLKCTSIA
jgi:hypothetical protein